VTKPPVVDKLKNVLVSLKQRDVTIEEAKDIVGEYCRERHLAGAKAETVLLEIKHIALPILYNDYAKIDKLVSKCVEDYFDARKRDLAKS
jgi:hypothetical protein